MGAGGQRAEDGGQKSEARSQRAEAEPRDLGYQPPFNHHFGKAFWSCEAEKDGYFGGMSTITLKVLELVKSLPPADQQTICTELAKHTARREIPRRKLERLPDGTYFNPEGIPNDHPFFKILEEDEAARHQDFGPPPPQFD
jgi:hypothetical protein